MHKFIAVVNILILVITSMQGIYYFIRETDHTRISRVYSVAVVLYAKFVLHIMLFRP
jgi:hypothetical protein